MSGLGQHLNYVRLTLLVSMLFTALAATVYRSPPIIFMASLLWATPLTVPFLGTALSRKLMVERRVPAEGTVGEFLIGEISVVNRSRLPTFLVHVESGILENHGTVGHCPQSLESAAGSTRIFALLLPGQRQSFEAKWRLPQRGVHRLRPARAGAMDPLCLFGQLACRSNSAEVLVLPRFHRVHRLGFLQDGAIGSQSAKYATAVADAMDFHGVRQWVPGESMRRIHWKSTARTGKLHVVEWEESLSCDIALLLDTQHATIAGEGATSSLETAISIAASVAMHLLEAGYLCQLLFWQQDVPTQPGLPSSLRLVNHEARTLAGSLGVLETLARVNAVDLPAADLPALASRVADLIPVDQCTLIVTTTLADIDPALTALARSRRATLPPQVIALDADSFGSLTTRGAAPTARRASHRPARNGSSAGRVRVVRLSDPIGATLERLF